jgi:hypothetical protein
MPTITIRLNLLPECCRQCLERCPECMLRAELWRQATWQLSHVIPQSARYLVEYQTERQSPGLSKPQLEKHESIQENIIQRAQGVRRSKKSRSG